MQAGGDAFDGVAFHCYAVSSCVLRDRYEVLTAGEQGNVAQQETFHEAFPTKEIYFSG